MLAMLGYILLGAMLFMAGLIMLVFCTVGFYVIIILVDIAQYEQQVCDEASEEDD